MAQWASAWGHKEELDRILEGQFHNTVFMQNQWVRCIPLTRPHQLGKPAPWLRLARSKLDVMGGQTLLFTPRVRLGGSASRQPPWLGAAWEAQSTAISWPRGSFRAWEACWAVLSLPCPAPPTLPYTLLLSALNCSLMLITKSASVNEQG